MTMMNSVWWSKPSTVKGKPFRASCYQLSTGKSVLILGVIVACFAILWPKIFYPMIEVALRTPKPRSSDNLAMVHPRVRQHLMKDIRYAKSRSINQPFIGLPSRSTIGHMKTKESGGLFNLLMPFYTIGLFVVFLYTILKFMSKEDEDDYVNEEQEVMDNEGTCKSDQPMIKDFQMDPEHRKFVFSEEYDDTGKNIKRAKAANLRLKRRMRNEKKSISSGNSSSNTILTDEGEEDKTIELNKDEQIVELKKRLEVTEDAMDRILKQIGSLNQILEAKGFLMDEISSITGYKEPDEVYQSDEEIINKKLDKNADEEHGTSGDSVYSSENQDKSTSEYDSDSSMATTSSKCELEE